jgi:hypothetical protein
VKSYVEIQSGQPDHFDDYVDRKPKNAYDIEYIVPDVYRRFQDEFRTESEFQDWRNHVAGLTLLPADVNRSLKAKSFAGKLPIYVGQNLYVASLGENPYQHHPQFAKFRSASGIPFKPYQQFTPVEQAERCEVVRSLVERIWSPDRIAGILPA